MPEAFATALPVHSFHDQGLLAIIMGAGWVVKGVMLLLLLFSVICWGIILTKAITLSRAR